MNISRGMNIYIYRVVICHKIQDTYQFRKLFYTSRICSLSLTEGWAYSLPLTDGWVSPTKGPAPLWERGSILPEYAIAILSILPLSFYSCIGFFKLVIYHPIYYNNQSTIKSQTVKSFMNKPNTFRSIITLFVTIFFQSTS